MNTDAILDFIVDYYIWFIVGGIIIIMAIIGFIADKRKMLPNQKKTKKVKKDEFKLDEVVNKEEEPLKEDVQTVDDMKESWNTNFNTLSNQNNGNGGNDYQENINASDNVNNEKTDYNYEGAKNQDTYDAGSYSKEYSGEESAYDNYVSEKDSHIDSYEENNYVKESNFDNYTKEDSQYNNGALDDNFKENDYIDNYKQDDSYYALQDEANHYVEGNEYEAKNDEETGNNYYEVNDEKIREVEKDIDKINDMFPEVGPSKEDEKGSKGEIKNIGDNPDQTLQVNYAQLREMVEDIIAETQNENKSVENHNDDSEEVKDFSLPNLDHISVDAIKEQDEDEDDVWKF